MENSHIGWTTHTFNPWIGCTKVSPGCLHCYAESLNKRWRGGANWGKGAPRTRTSPANWNKVLRWNIEAGKSVIRPRVFCASLADWLDEEVSNEWLADLLHLIRMTPNLDWLLLSKRPQNWYGRLIRANGFLAKQGDILKIEGDPHWETAFWIAQWLEGHAPANVWVGTTVEDQTRAAERIPELVKIPARVRFLSCEPLLEEIGIQFLLKYVSWVICGGESGPGCRPMSLHWAQDLLCQCKVERVPFFMKQLGGHPSPVTEIESFPSMLRVREFPV